MKKLETILASRQGRCCFDLTLTCIYVALFSISSSNHSSDIVISCSFFCFLFADELSGDVFDMLLNLGEFTEFKDLMISFKQSKAQPNGGLDFSIAGKRV